jgi:hypothetical protein
MSKLRLVASTSVAIILLLTRNLTAETYLHEPTGIMFPEQLSGLEKRPEVEDYESQTPGLGVGINYAGPGIKVSVFVYSLCLNEIPNEEDSSILRAEFEKVNGDIRSAQEKGWYKNVRKLSEPQTMQGLAVSKSRALHARYSYTEVERGKDCLSEIYLFPYRNHFVKIRITYVKESKHANEEIQKEFVEELCRVIGKT